MTNNIQVGLSGLKANLDSFNRTAARISRNAPGGDLSGDMVQMIQDKRGVQVNAEVVRTADDLVGTMLDIMV